VSEAVAETDDHQNECVRNHDGLVADAVDDTSDHRRCEKTRDCGYREQQADDRCACTVHHDENIRAKGDENLLPCTVEHFKHIVLGVLLAEVEPALGGVRFAPSADPEGAQHTQTGKDSRTDKEEGIRLICGDHRERHNDDYVTDQRTDLGHRILYTESCTAVVTFGVLQCQRAFHAHLDMFTERIHTDGKSGENLGRRKSRMHRHTEQHDDRTGFVHRLHREHIECREDQYKRHPGQFAEEFGYASVRFGHADDFRHEVVEHAFVQPVRYAGDQHRHQEHFKGGVFVK